jgi:hypothetical protein
MPGGPNPPPTTLTSTVFNAIHGMTYDVNGQCFRDANNNQIFLGVGDDGTGKEQWFYGTNTDIGINPKAIIPSATGTIIIHGTFSNGVVVYQNTNYAIRFQRDTQGNHVASANVV